MTTRAAFAGRRPARLAGALSRWQRYAPPYAEAMRGELETLAATSLSRDLFEVVSKSLGRG